ncbi:hypothetical protein GALL_432030 [mine drainage metagenome]|uniref:Uncharacterized protein n=1 Tax=mine drainage metagenome TaxID=410659 RepID=A0A1J5Q5G2_9ZZZZ
MSTLISPTPDVIAASYAGALYGLELSNTDIVVVNSTAAANGGNINSLLNSVFNADFSSYTNAQVAAIVAHNVGLAGTLATAATVYITDTLNAAVPGTQGQTIATILRLFAGLTSDPTWGAAALAWNSQVTTADNYANNAANMTRAPLSVGFTSTLTGTGAIFNGGIGNHTFNGTASDGGGGASGNTFNGSYFITGGAGVNTLNISPNFAIGAGDAVTSLQTDSIWAHVSHIQNVVIATNAGAQNITTGADFNTAFAQGINLMEISSGGAITDDMSSFSGAATLVTSSGAGAQTITTGSGLATVNATSTAGALTINGANLTAVIATTTGAGAQTIGTTNGAALVTVTATDVSGSQTITSTSPLAVSVNATSVSGQQSITTGLGNDIITLSNDTAGATINAGAGTNTIVLGVGHSAVDAITVTGLVGARDNITYFSLSVSDTLALGTTVVLTSAQLGGGFTVTNGIATGGTNVAFMAAAESSTTAGVVAHNDGNNTYVVASDGSGNSAHASIIELVGVNTATAVGGGGATAIHIL